MSTPNAACLLFDHDWHWREPIRVRMCRRCYRFDVPRSTSPDPVPGGDSPLAVPQSARTLSPLSRRDARVGGEVGLPPGDSDRLAPLPAAGAAAAGALPG